MLSCCLQLPLNNAEQKSMLKVNLDWESKGILGLQGPSGSGKSTLLKQIAGFGEINSSADHSIKWNDVSLESSQHYLKAHQRPVTLVFQQHPLFPHLSVHQNLEFARKHGYGSITDAEFQSVISDFDLTPLLDKSSLHLSGGQQSRIALVQGLIARPELLLLDEPFSALDFETRHKTVQALKAHAEKLTIAIILVSHAPQELASICDQLIIINKQQLSGPHKDILKVLNEENTSPQSLIRTTTFIKAKLKSYDKKNHLACFDVVGIDFLVACKGKPNEKEIIEVPASEVSLLLEQPTATSIANCIAVVLESWKDVEDGCLLQLKFNQQLLACKITQYSFQKLKLEQGKVLFAQFKATAIGIL